MAKRMTYAEQLAHPNWQRVRLERLNAAGFKCEECDADDKALHVHHKQYFKGRMAWEYSPDELQVLCKDCHSSHHREEESFKELLVGIHQGIAFALVGGRYLDSDWIDRGILEEARQTNHSEFMRGAIANFCDYLPDEDVLRVMEFAVSLTKENSQARHVYKEYRETFERCL